MALTKAKIVIPFSKGLNEKVDGFLLEQGQLTTAENVEFNHVGSVSHRPGLAAVGSTTKIKGLFNSGKSLLYGDGNRLYSYNESGSSWVDSGPLCNIGIETTPIDAPTTATTNKAYHKGAIVGNYYVSFNNARLQVVDIKSRKVVHQEAVALIDVPVGVSGDGTGNAIIAYEYLNGAAYEVNTRIFNLTTMTLGSATLIGAANAYYQSAYVPYGNIGLLAFIDTAARIQCATIDSTGTVWTDVITPVGLDTTNSGRLYLGENSGTAYVGYRNTSGGIGYVTFQIGTANKYGGTTVIAGGASWSYYGGHMFADGAQNMIFAVTSNYGTASALPEDRGVSIGRLEYQAGAATLAQIFYGCSVFDGCFQDQDGTNMLCLYFADFGHTSQPLTQSMLTYYHLDFTTLAINLAAVFATGLLQEDGTVYGTVSGGQYYSTDKKYLYSIVEQQNPADSGFVAKYIPTLYCIDRDGEFLQSEDINGVTYFSGGLPRAYDGYKSIWAGFPMYPRFVNTMIAETTGGSLVVGETYQFKIVYRMTDARGNIIESTPSPYTLSQTMTAGNQTIQLKAPHLKMYDDALGSYKVYIDVYMTEGNLDVFYYKQTVTNNEASSFTTLNITSVVSDTERPLYTEGGNVENMPPGAIKHIGTNGDRLFAVDYLNRLWYSKKAVTWRGIGFNDTFILASVGQQNSINAMSVMDGRVVLVGDKGTWYYSGQGPNNQGVGGGFSEPMFMPSSSYAKRNHRGAIFEAGMVFGGSRGVELLSRQMTIITPSFGAKLYDTIGKDAIIYSIVARSGKDQIWVFSDSGTYVYDIFSQNWSKFVSSATSPRYGAVVGDDFYIASSTTVHKEERPATAYADAGTYYASKIKTPWIKTSGILGVQRVYKAAILYRSTAASFTVKVYYDYDGSTVSETHTFGSTTVEQFFKFRLNRQKCSSVMFEVTTGAVAKEVFDIVGIQLEIGGKYGMIKSLQSLSV